MKKRSIFTRFGICLLPLSIMLNGCQILAISADEPHPQAKNPQQAPQTAKDQKDAQTEIIEFDGHVVFNSFEGGFWGLVSNDGKHYDPGSLSSEFQINGLPIHAKVIPQRDVNSFRMWGVIVKLVGIERIKDGAKPFPGDQDHRAPDMDPEL